MKKIIFFRIANETYKYFRKRRSKRVELTFSFPRCLLLKSKVGDDDIEAKIVRSFSLKACQQSTIRTSKFSKLNYLN